MMQVWFLFKIIELTMGTISMVFHTLGFMDKEPLPHIMLFCGTFFGFALFSGMGAIAIVVGATPPPLVECIINFTAAVMYIMCSITSMHYAENDFHLMYLSDFEEPLHPYFAFCRSQSISSLAAGAMHLLHAILAFDVLFVSRPSLFDEEGLNDTDTDEDLPTDELRHQIRMYFLSRYIETKLRRNVWFDNLCQRKNPPIRIYSFCRSHRESRESEGINMYEFDGKGQQKESTVDKKRPSMAARPNSDSEDEKELKSALQSFRYGSAHTYQSAVSREELTEQSTPSISSQKIATRFELPSDKTLSATQSVITVRGKEDFKPPILRRSEKNLSDTATDNSIEKDLRISIVPPTPKMSSLPKIKEKDLEQSKGEERQLSEIDLKPKEAPKTVIPIQRDDEEPAPIPRTNEEDNYTPTVIDITPPGDENGIVPIVSKLDTTPMIDPQLPGKGLEFPEASEVTISPEQHQPRRVSTIIADDKEATNIQDSKQKFPQNWKTLQAESTEKRFPQIHPTLSDDLISSSDDRPGPSRRGMTDNETTEESQYNTPTGSFYDGHKIDPKNQDQNPKPKPPPPPPEQQ